MRFFAMCSPQSRLTVYLLVFCIASGLSWFRVWERYHYFNRYKNYPGDDIIISINTKIYTDVYVRNDICFWCAIRCSFLTTYLDLHNYVCKEWEITSCKSTRKSDLWLIFLFSSNSREWCEIKQYFLSVMPGWEDVQCKDVVYTHFV